VREAVEHRVRGRASLVQCPSSGTPSGSTCGASEADRCEGIIPRDFSVTLQRQTLEVPAGTWIARAAQRRAGLLFHWMEPEDPDSYAAGGWFINHEGEGNLFPVHRLRALPGVPMQVRGSEDFR
jgi:hypothetical protein